MPIELKSKQKDAAASGAPKKRTAAVRGRVPNKQSINLATVGIKKTNWGVVILVLVLIFLALGAAGKFLILDRVMEVKAAEAEADEVLLQINMVNMKIKQYGEMNDIYAHYTYTGMTEEEVTALVGSEDSQQSSFKLSGSGTTYPPETTLVYYIGKDHVDELWLILSFEDGICVSYTVDIT